MTDLYPAIDLLGGRVVRLRQGDYADETVAAAAGGAIVLGAIPLTTRTLSTCRGSRVNSDPVPGSTETVPSTTPLASNTTSS